MYCITLPPGLCNKVISYILDNNLADSHLEAVSHILWCYDLTPYGIDDVIAYMQLSDNLV